MTEINSSIPSYTTTDLNIGPQNQTTQVKTDPTKMDSIDRSRALESQSLHLTGVYHQSASNPSLMKPDSSEHQFNLPPSGGGGNLPPQLNGLIREGNPYFSTSTLTVFQSIMGDLMKYQSKARFTGAQAEIEAGKLSLLQSQVSSNLTAIMTDVRVAEKVFQSASDFLTASVAALSLYKAGDAHEKAESNVNNKIEERKEEIDTLKGEVNNLQKAIGVKGENPVYQQELKELEAKLVIKEKELSEMEDPSTKLKNIADEEKSIVNNIIAKNDKFKEFSNNFEKAVSDGLNGTNTYLESLKELSEAYKSLLNKFADSFASDSSRENANMDASTRLMNKVIDTAYMNMQG